YNLLSNSSKYNKEKGTVWVDLSYEKTLDSAVLVVKDNGEGISEEAQKTLFKRFYEGDYRKFNTIGTGIGLSLTKDLVELHQGTISVQSKLGEGTAFKVIIPINRGAYKEENIDDKSDVLPVAQHIPVEVVEEEEEGQAEEKGGTLLLVEDNEDLLMMMTKLLKANYNVYTACNGKEGIEVIGNKDVDLIVSDVMMPEMDGLEFCRYVKGHFDTSHIPVILLTAKNKEEDRVEAYEAGADAFISKPFNLSVLHARISNLLKTRERANKDFKKQLVFEVDELNYTSIDEEFLQKAIGSVQAHLDDPLFDQTRFVEEVGVSKSTLFRKLKSLTGLSYSSFVRNIRMKAACRIMEEKRNVRISELAYAVGFNDPKYFSACFKKELGMHPSEYMERFINGGKSENDEENPVKDR
ncbi:response regulator, partial [Bacteroides salyersiae]